MNPARRIRLLLAAALLLISLTLLAWGLLPSVREYRTRRLPPGEIQIPTPAAVLPDPGGWSAVPGPGF